MTYRELLLLLESFRTSNHVSIDERVTLLWNNEEYYLDIVESLTDGRVILIPKLLSDIDTE